MTFNSYSLAGDDPNPMTVVEVDCLKKLIREFTARNPAIINIGAGRGVSTLAMLEESPFATIYSVDITPCEGEIKNAQKAGLDTSRIIRLLGSSRLIGRHWSFPVDFIWVDGDHSYEGVKGDILVWSRHIVSGGVMAFHDCFDGDPPAHNPSGAGKAVRELMNPDDLIMSCERIRAFRR